MTRLRDRLVEEGVLDSADDKKTGRRKYDLVSAGADYREWSGPPQQTLLICTQQRSGSTLLGEAIYFAGGFGCPLEYFHRGFRPGFERRWGKLSTPAYAGMVHRFRTDPSGVFSVKLFWRDVIDLIRDLAPAEFDWLSQATASRSDASPYRRMYEIIAVFFPSPTFVFLNRRDSIARAVSMSVARQTQRWRQLSRIENAQPATYDFDDIVQRLAETQNEDRHWRNFFRVNALPFHIISYEDLAGDYEATLRNLFTRLARPDAAITPPRLQKQANAQSEAIALKFLAEFRARAGGGNG